MHVLRAIMNSARFSSGVAVVSMGLLGLVGCGAAADSATGDDVELRSSERGFEYECTTPASRTLIEKPSTKVLVTPGHLRFDSDYGLSLGERDKTYKAPTGTTRARYAGYETGEDCVMKLVADQALLDGEATGKLRIQCAGDDFQQDTLSCANPKAAKLTLLPPAPPPPPAPSVPPASARKWACTTTSEYPSLEEGSLTMQVVDDSIRLLVAEFDYTGTRNRDYRPRSGNWIAYNDLDYGGDCTMTVIVDPNALVSSTTATTLKVRCAGEGYQEDIYACTPSR